MKDKYKFSTTEQEILALIKNNTISKVSCNGIYEGKQTHIMTVKARGYELNLHYTHYTDSESKMESITVHKARLVIYSFLRGSKTYNLDTESQMNAYRVLIEAYNERKGEAYKDKVSLFEKWKQKYCI